MRRVIPDPGAGRIPRKSVNRSIRGNGLAWQRRIISQPNDVGNSPVGTVARSDWLRRILGNKKELISVIASITCERPEYNRNPFS